jgi:hypothetical protein
MLHRRLLACAVSLPWADPRAACPIRYRVEGAGSHRGREGAGREEHGELVHEIALGRSVVDGSGVALSTALLPISSVLADVLQSYLVNHWRDNPRRMLFPSRKGTQPLWRDNVVKYALKADSEETWHPCEVCRAARLQARTGDRTCRQEHAHTCDAEADAACRHTHNAAVYAHVIPQSQRDAMKAFQLEQFRLWNRNKQQPFENKEVGGSVWESNSNVRLPTHGE